MADPHTHLPFTRLASFFQQAPTQSLWCRLGMSGMKSPLWGDIYDSSQSDFPFLFVFRLSCSIPHILSCSIANTRKCHRRHHPHVRWLSAGSARLGRELSSITWFHLLSLKTGKCGCRLVKGCALSYTASKWPTVPTPAPWPWRMLSPHQWIPSSTIFIWPSPASLWFLTISSPIKLPWLQSNTTWLNYISQNGVKWGLPP